MHNGRGITKPSSTNYLAASPTHTVETSGRICLIMSNMAIPVIDQSKKINRNFNERIVQNIKKGTN